MFNFTIFLPIFGQKIELANIHKYANQLICIFEFYAKGQWFNFNLIPNLLFYDE